MLAHIYDSAKRWWLHQPAKPVIFNECGLLSQDSGKLVFVVVCGPGFDMSVPNAGMTSRMGWCHGFEEIGIPYILISVFELASRLPEIPRPLCWISASDYMYLNNRNLRALKKTEHFVWVNTWFKGETEFYATYNYQNNSDAKQLNEKIISSDPSFVFTIAPEGSFEYFETWIQQGLKLVSLPLACDTSVYTGQTADVPEFGCIEMAFVGGYWPYKALQFDRYLKPYSDRLKVFGYSPWPYAGYGGQIPVYLEASLYAHARLSPSINEPHVEKMGIDINERVFKVLGSGGMTITDVTPGYRELFTGDELLVPDSINDYHDMVHDILKDEDLNRQYRERGRAAVLSRHTYAHRAKAVLDFLNQSSELRSDLAVKRLGMQ